MGSVDFLFHFFPPPVLQKEMWTYAIQVHTDARFYAKYDIGPQSQTHRYVGELCANKTHNEIGK